MINHINMNYVIGDCSIPEHKVENCENYIIHICNDVGKWGKGFVIPLGNEHPLAKNSYLSLKDKGYILGMIQIVYCDGITIINMIAQKGIKGKHPLCFESLESCLQLVSEELSANDIIHMPRIGCGLGGGNWKNDIEPLIQKYFTECGISCFVYDQP